MHLPEDFSLICAFVLLLSDRLAFDLLLIKSLRLEDLCFVSDLLSRAFRVVLELLSLCHRVRGFYGLRKSLDLLPVEPLVDFDHVIKDVVFDLIGSPDSSQVLNHLLYFSYFPKEGVWDHLWNFTRLLMIELHFIVVYLRRLDVELWDNESMLLSLFLFDQSLR